MAKKTSVEALFVKSKVREYIKGKNCNTSGGVIDGTALNDAIIDIGHGYIQFIEDVETIDDYPFVEKSFNGQPEIVLKELE